MIEQLFGSKTRVKLLKLFFSNPNRQFYVREITRKIDEQINSVRRELSNLLSIGIIVSDSNNNKLYYEVNQKFKYYDPLRQMFSSEASLKSPDKKKVTTQNDSKDSDELSSVGHVELAVLTGQFTRDETSGIDLLIVGDVNPNALKKYVDNLEKKESKSIRYTLLGLEDFKYRLEINDRFASAIISSKTQILVDNLGLLKNETDSETKKEQQ